MSRLLGLSVEVSDAVLWIKCSRTGKIQKNRQHATCTTLHVEYLISCHLIHEFNFKILRYTKFVTQSSVFNMPFGSHPACSYFPAALCAFRNFPVKTRVSVSVSVFHLSAYRAMPSAGSGT